MVHEGMTLAQVRHTMSGFQEEQFDADLPYQQSFEFGWDLHGDSDMDQISVDLTEGKVVKIFIGSE